MASHAHAAGEA